MPGIVAEEVAGAVVRRVRLPRSAGSRQALTYIQLLANVTHDRTWGGWSFQGRALRPGAVIEENEIPQHGLALECAGTLTGGRGHNRAPMLYILWRYSFPEGEWREVARSASVERDWTQGLGPIARRELAPLRPVLVDLDGAASRVSDAITRELEPLSVQAQVLVVRRVQDLLMARMAG
jgi:hypothetical protein